MGAPRQKDLLARRRRRHDDEEDDEGEGDGSAAGMGGEDDESSQASLPSDTVDDADAEGSEPSNRAGGGGRSGDARSRKKNNGIARSKNTSTANSGDPPPTFAAAVADTEAMMNGMKIVDDGTPVEEVDFDGPGDTARADDTSTSAGAAGRNETIAERRRREHEEYKRRRDADPAFVPNRGGFFMHDQRSSPTGQNGFRPPARGRGRARGFGGPFSPLGTTHNAADPSDAPWTHDLHDAVIDNGKRPIDTAKTIPAQQAARPTVQPQTQPPPNRSFSRTTQVGNVQLRVYMTGMKEPILFSAVPVNQHTRLPHHRPPLRRDKPVRVSLPENAPRYIFPAVDRSFIFIPRALRPNQQAFARGRGRGSFGYASGRGSVYGGSGYSPSIGMSRRSSIARDLRDGMISPTGSAVSRGRSIAMEAGRPVVRLPPAGEINAAMQPPMHMPTFGTPPVPIVNLPMLPPYAQPQPQVPLSYESLPPSLPMHQPRPQKAVSVAGIEGPEPSAAQHQQHPHHQQQQQAQHPIPQQMVQQAPQLHPQPFHQQMPMAMNGQNYVGDQNVYPHSRRPSHASQRGTPLSHIPERAIHAQPFQPYPYQPQPSFYPQAFATPVYYYPQAGPSMPSMGAPAFVPGQQYPYMVSPTGGADSTQAGTVAHESNGMVYYYDPSQLQVANEDAGQYPGMGYPSPGGYMMPQHAVYYPSQ